MTTPGGAGTLWKAHFTTLPVLGAPASIMGWSYQATSVLLGSNPLLCRGPMPQGVSYVRHEYASLYIRNIMPTGARLSAVLALSGWGYATPQSRRLRPVSM